MADYYNPVQDSQGIPLVVLVALMKAERRLYELLDDQGNVDYNDEPQLAHKIWLILKNPEKLHVFVDALATLRNSCEALALCRI